MNSLIADFYPLDLETDCLNHGVFMPFFYGLSTTTKQLGINN